MGYVPNPRAPQPRVATLPEPQRRAPQAPPRIGTGISRNYYRPGGGSPEANIGGGLTDRRALRARPGGNGDPDSIVPGLPQPGGLVSQAAIAAGLANKALDSGPRGSMFALGPGPVVRPHSAGGEPLPLVNPDQARGALGSGPRVHFGGAAPRAHGGKPLELTEGTSLFPDTHLQELGNRHVSKMNAIDTTSTVRPRRASAQAGHDARRRASWADIEDRM